MTLLKMSSPIIDTSGLSDPKKHQARPQTTTVIGTSLTSGPKKKYQVRS